jgi:molecular chaperone GrpE
MAEENLEQQEEQEEQVNEEVQNPEVTEVVEQVEKDIKEETLEQTEKEVSEVQKISKELLEMKDKYLRLYSEFENFRKRTQKEKTELIFTANEDVILSLLPIVDDFERGMKANVDTEEVAVVKEGVQLIYDKFEKLLNAKGLKPINATGQEFDTELHEAITQIPSPDEEMKGKVIDEVEKGYKLGDKVIRYSKVVVGA